jgi:hypothetical protein
MLSFTPRPHFPEEEIRVPIEYEAGRVPGLVWTLRRGEKSLPFGGN